MVLKICPEMLEWGGDFTSLVGGDLRRLIFKRSSCNREKKIGVRLDFQKLEF